VLPPGGRTVTPTSFESGDPRVDAALTGIAATDPTRAEQAAHGFAALTWRTGLPAVSLRGLQDYLWYQMPYKHGELPVDQRATAHALGVLFDRLGMPHHADTCRSPTTEKVLTAGPPTTRPGSPLTATPWAAAELSLPTYPACWSGVACSASRNTPRSGPSPTISNRPSPPACTRPAAPAGASPPPASPPNA
jgi:hypothetical protein